MNEDLDKKLKQAQEDHRRMQSNFEIGKVHIYHVLVSHVLSATPAVFNASKLRIEVAFYG